MRDYRAGIRSALLNSVARTAGQIPPPERTSKRKRSPEGNLQRAILEHFKNDPRVFLWRQSAGVMRTPDGQRTYSVGLSGAADITGWIKGSGRRIEIEVKGPGGTLRKSQEHFKSLCEKGGVLYIEARSIDDIEAAITPR